MGYTLRNAHDQERGSRVRHVDSPLDRFFEHVKATGYRGDFTFEATGFDPQGKIHLDTLNEQFRLARKYMKYLDAEHGGDTQ